MKFDSDFECGKICKVEEKSKNECDIYIEKVFPINRRKTSPQVYSWWWYFCVDMEGQESAVINIIYSERYQFHMPVYSYDNEKWRRFDARDVEYDKSSHTMKIKLNSAKKIWIASFYPYTYTRLQKYLKCAEDRVCVEVIGKSNEGRDIYGVKFDCTSGDNKNMIWIHARTHPGESNGSFISEAFISEIIENKDLRESILKKTSIYIVPMHNVDGVVEGEYYTNANNANLEIEWRREDIDERILKDDIDHDVKVLNGKICELQAEGYNFLVALNVHASHGKEDLKTFFFDHFGPKTMGYSDEEAILWEKQKKFIDLLRGEYDDQVENSTMSKDNKSFVNSVYPESWWWANFKDEVMAVTLESVYGKNKHGKWIVEKDLYELGRSLAHALNNYVK